MRQQRLTVLMHHLVSNDTSHVAVRPAVFEEQCRTLAENGWFGISLQQAEEFLLHGETLPPKSFLMTFDDGYLDNYVYAWPIMRKYGHKGVIFAVTERLSQAQAACAANDPSSQNLARKTIQDVWDGNFEQNNLYGVDSLLHPDELGYTVRQDLFFNWDEARLMEQSGVIAIAGHSLRHARVFSGPNFSGFAKPGDQLRTFIVPDSCWGMPNFTSAPELTSRAFIPSPSLVEEVKKLVPQDKVAADEFFRSQNDIAALETLIEQHADNLGTIESLDAFEHRLQNTMSLNQSILHKELGHPVKSFCWPWGVFCSEAQKQGLTAGFEVFYTTKLGLNPPAAPLAVHRIKVKNRTDAWLLNRLRIYSSPILGAFYHTIRL